MATVTGSSVIAMTTMKVAEVDYHMWYRSKACELHVHVIGHVNYMYM